MAALTDLINQVQDANLRDRLLQEASKLQKQRKFGLVYEEHIPEATLLYDVLSRKGTIITRRLCFTKMNSEQLLWIWQ